MCVSILFLFSRTIEAWTHRKAAENSNVSFKGALGLGDCTGLVSRRVLKKSLGQVAQKHPDVRRPTIFIRLRRAEE